MWLWALGTPLGLVLIYNLVRCYGKYHEIQAVQAYIRTKLHHYRLDRKETKAELLPGGLAYKITANFSGKIQTIYIPYQRHLVYQQCGETVTLIDDMGKRVPLEYPRGVPYNITPHMLGYKYAEIRDLESGEVRLIEEKDLIQ